MMKITKLKLADCVPNTGQIPGLPINPRQWTKGDVDRIAASLAETPELFDARPLLVYKHDGQYVILGGNLRYEGARQNGMAEVPAIVFPAETSVEKMKEIVIKDNGSFGAWDTEALAADWKDLELGEWGVPAWKVSGDVNIDALFDPEKEAPVKPKPTIIEVSVPYGMEEKVEEIRAALREVARNYSGVTVV